MATMQRSDFSTPVAKKSGIAANALDLRKRLHVKGVDSGRSSMDTSDVETLEGRMSAAQTPTTLSLQSCPGDTESFGNEEGENSSIQTKDPSAMMSPADLMRSHSAGSSSSSGSSRTAFSPRNQKELAKNSAPLNGKHTITDQYKTKVTGFWRDNILHGQAKMIFQNGASFEGEFKDGLMDGNGTWKGIHGEVYSGEWKNSYIHGKGQFLYPDGSTYNGDWHWGVIWGKGKFVYADKSEYEGRFSNGQRHGNGRTKYANGDQQWAVWSFGNKWITYCYLYANGDVYNRNGATKFCLKNEEEAAEQSLPPAPPKPEPGAFRAPQV